MYWFLIVCFFSLPVRAQTDSGNTGLALVRSFLGKGVLQKVWDTGGHATRSAGDSPSLSGYAREGGGFAVLLKTDGQCRVVGYSTDGTLPPVDSMPEPLMQFLDEANSATILSRSVNDTGHDGTELLLSTPDWGQSAPFNAQTPMDGDRRCLTGCTSVALGAIMAYHRWPEKGRGAVSHT